MPDWVVKDNGFRPVRLVLDVTSNPLNPLVPDRMRIQTDPVGLYPDVDLPLPSALSTRTFRIPVQLPPDLSNTADAPCPPFLSTNCSSYWLQELVLKIKLADWYNRRFAPTTCTEFTINGDHAGTFMEFLATRAVSFPRDPMPIGSTNSVCGP